MSALERLAQSAQLGHGVGGYTFIDADTLEKDGQKFRIQGYDAPEISRFTETGEILQTGNKLHLATAGAGTSTGAIPLLAQENGFTNPVPLFNDDGSPMMDATGSRQMLDLRDEAGRSFTTELLKSGALNSTVYTSQADMEAVEVAKLYGESHDFDKHAQDVSDAIIDETSGPVRLRRAAISEQDYQFGGGSSNLAFRKNDRSIDNRAYDPLSDSWERGWIGAKEGYYGMLELLGDEFETDWLQDIGEAGVARARAQQHEYADVLTDWKDVNGIMSGVEYLANNAAMSLPYMVVTGASAAAGALAAPVVGTTAAIAGSIAVPSMIYAGQTWNEMEGEKNAKVALTAGLIQGALDRLSIGLVSGSGKTLASNAVKEIMKSKGLGKEAAEQLLASATKQELADFIRASGAIATKQLVAKKTAQEFLQSAAQEGLTEVMQEATAYVAATQGSDKVFDWDELKERMTAAAIAGSALGGAFSVPGSVKNAVSYDAMMKDTLAADDITATNSAIWAKQEETTRGYVATNRENLAEIHATIKSQAPSLTLDEHVEMFEAQNKDKKRTVTSTIKDFLDYAWYTPARGALTDSVLSRSRAARVLADLVGANPDRVFSGASFEEEKHHRVTRYRNMVGRHDQFYNVMNNGKSVTAKDKQRISELFYAVVNKATDKNGVFQPDLVSKDVQHRDAIIKMATEINNLSDTMHADQAKHNPELGYIKNYLHKYKTMNKQAVYNGRAKFKNLLMSEFNMNADEAQAITDAIVDDPNVGDLNEAFSVVKGGIVPSSHQKRSLGLSENVKFQEFMEQDLFANVAHAAKSAARYTAHRDFIGQNGSVISKLLDQMQEDGLTSEEIGYVAKRMKEYLDAESGNFKRPNTKIGKKMVAMQKHVMMMMTFAGLPLAMPSSMVEAALISRSVDGGGLKTIKSFSRDTAKGLMNYMMGTVEAVTGKDSYKADNDKQAKLREAGFYDWDVGAATVTGVTEVNARHQNWYSAFFKANGLTQWTDYTRALRISFAGDYLSQNMALIIDNRRNGSPYSREVQEAELKLRNTGVNISRLLPIYEKVGAQLPLTPEEQMFYDEQMRDLSYNFVNEAIMLPQAQNRPLLYQDPRFALFTQFQGFISTFTTKLLPRLYKDAFGKGTKSMQYSAFATMMTMIMLGFLSQAIKDWIKYDTFGQGDDDYEFKTGRNPYLDTPEYIQRGLLSTGLLGTGERVIEQLFPIYEQRSDGVGDWIFNQATGESPSLGYLKRVAGAAGSLASGDVGRAAEQAGKAAPIFGPFSLVNKKIGEAASTWNFKGDE